MKIKLYNLGPINIVTKYDSTSFFHSHLSFKILNISSESMQFSLERCFIRSCFVNNLGVLKMEKFLKYFSFLVSNALI
uniref:Ovule protein n=1 Tax=Panagrolaimus sp. PS1159 TaxID=55785 RepID=A0AC35G691_9BILA